MNDDVIVLTREEAALAADALWAVAGLQRGARITRTNFAQSCRALAERLDRA